VSHPCGQLAMYVGMVAMVGLSGCAYLHYFQMDKRLDGLHSSLLEGGRGTLGNTLGSASSDFDFSFRFRHFSAAAPSSHSAASDYHLFDEAREEHNRSGPRSNTIAVAETVRDNKTRGVDDVSLSPASHLSTIRLNSPAQQHDTLCS
jgi:hypothetical protein